MSKESILDWNWKAVAELEDAQVRNLEGIVVASIQGDKVIDIFGTQIGTYRCGIFRDQGGHIVAHLPGALAMGISSMTYLGMLPAYIGARVRTGPRHGWSEFTWEQFTSPTSVGASEP